MRKVIKSIGHGLLAAGTVLVAMYFVGIYLKGIDALRDALNPFNPANYLGFAPLVPGILLLWLVGHSTARHDVPVDHAG